VCEADLRISHLLGEKEIKTLGVARHSHIVRHPEIRKSLEEASDRLRQFSEPGLLEQLPCVRLTHLLHSCAWLQADSQSLPTIEQARSLSAGLLEIWIGLAPARTLDPYLDDHPTSVGRRIPDDDETPGPFDERAWALYDVKQKRFREAHERARTALRTHYLQRVGLVLWVTVIAAATAGAFAADDKSGTALTALAGAMGGTLSGARALRDTVALRRSRTFQAWWWVQPAVGAAVGLLMYALLSSPILALPGTDSSGWARLSSFVVYAFAAGFSEPFVLGVLAKITGAADVAADVQLQTNKTAPEEDDTASKESW
jgi:hypothetical protein